MNISLHIERLVLDGLPLDTAQGAALQASLTAELARLLRERGLSGLSGGAVPQLAVNPIQLSPYARPAHWGTQIARSLHAGLASTGPGPARL